MGLWAIILLGLGLSLDAFAVSLSMGLIRCGVKKSALIRFPIVVGLFHLMMILIGWFLGDSSHEYIEHYDHYIAFLLLAFVGIKMIKESFDKQSDKEQTGKIFSIKNTCIISLAISIDALITGFSLGMVPPQLGMPTVFGNILISGIIIGLAALIISVCGLIIGRTSKTKLGSKAELLGGVILFLLGVKILVEHLTA